MRALLLVMLAACSSESKLTDAAVQQHDAPKVADAAAIDGPPATVMTVDCASATASATVMTASFAFVPMAVTIQVGQVVKFTTESFHDVVPDPSTATDPGMHIDFGATGCLKFTKAGTFGYKCAPHGFKGSVTVN